MIRILDLPTLLPTLDRQELETWASSIEFLIREGLVVGRRVTATSPMFANVGLTREAMQLLNSVPRSVADTTTWAERLKSAVRFGTKEAVSAVIPPTPAAVTGEFKP